LRSTLGQLEDGKQLGSASPPKLHNRYNSAVSPAIVSADRHGNTSAMLARPSGAIAKRAGKQPRAAASRKAPIASSEMWSLPPMPLDDDGAFWADAEVDLGRGWSGIDIDGLDSPSTFGGEPAEPPPPAAAANNNNARNGPLAKGPLDLVTEKPGYSPIFDSPSYCADLGQSPRSPPPPAGDDEMGKIEWWGSMEPLVAAAPLVSTVGLQPQGQGHLAISVSLAGRERHIEFAQTVSAHDLLRSIGSAFGLADGTPFVLRHVLDGCIMACTSLLPPGPFALELINETVNPAAATRAPPIRPPAQSGATVPSLEWVQEPPKGLCEWLTVKVTKRGEPKPLAHTFDVEIAATHGTADPRSVLNDARIRLFNPALEDVSHLLHAGTKTLRKTAAGRHVVRWGEVGITEVSSSQSAGVANVELKGANAIKGGRCAQGWFHLCISSAGAADLWLRSGAAEDPEELGKIIVKHKRCYATGRWVEKRLGPYADHSLCRPSHVGADGRRRCGTGCC